MSKSIEVATLQQWLAEGRPVTVLDVRPREQFDEWRIPGSLHVDAYRQLKEGDEEILGSLDLPDDRPVVTVCVAGNTSQIAAGQLERRGFEVASLVGGMKAWSLAWNEAELSLPGDVHVLQVRRAGKGCLSYLISSHDEALVIDPSLGEQVYLDLARERGVKIVGVLDTHVHADHLSRARGLAEMLNVPRYLPAQERVGCPFTPLSNDDEVRFGNSRLKVISTPGHTWESSVYALEGAILTGDTLFTDSVGRPDLEADPQEAERRAAALHESLAALSALPTETLVLPGHTDEPPDFSGTPVVASLAQVRANIGLLALEKEAFIEYLTAHLPAAPANHALIVQFNEACELPQTAGELEAGANRCAVH